MDATYKADLQRLNDLNWDRFGAEMRAQFAEFRSEMDARFAALRSEMDARFAALCSEMDARFAALHSEMDARFAAQDVRIAELRAELIKWMFVFWAGTVIPLAALMVGLAQ